MTGLRLDLYIAAIGRSGSTALANRLTNRPAQTVLVEPTSAAFGYSKYDLLRNPADVERYVAAADMLLGADQAADGKVGIKEVSPECHHGAIESLSPKSVVVLVRDMQQVALSYLEKSARQGSEVFDLAWTERYCVESAATLVELASSHAPNMVVVRYEDIFYDQAAYDTLLKHLGWSGGGDQFANFDSWERSYEVERNAIPRAPALNVGDRGLSAADQLSSFRISERCTAYQERFGFR